MIYQLVVKPGVQRQLRQLDSPALRRIMRKFQQLQQNPRPPNAQKLHGRLEGYRVRVGDWRILYQIDDQAKEVRVYRIKHRSQAYR
ncbi:MAG: type II toxin-antitoxin system RelE/ParE family toxin [Candidatus Bipolaricaulota bacterium]|nr:type II toxin-antitoxin system RelE/ParE family toxin [Candidatus Bipolaricaulota bacterium]MDW8141015.1 type II toxin-antitoxin system RelE/ParE family toxin [Candidatus Bipolaricaulota bacterium]